MSGVHLLRGRSYGRYGSRIPETLSVATSTTGGPVWKRDNEEVDHGNYRFRRRFLVLLSNLLSWAKNLIVPAGTFGTDSRARRTERCAVLVYLSVWIPVYIIVICFFFVVFQSGWLEGMSVQTSYVNTLPAPSLIFCPPDIQCGLRVTAENIVDGWSPPFHQYGMNSSELFTTQQVTPKQYVPHILPAAALNLSFLKANREARRHQKIDGDVLYVCGCGQCVCLRSSRVSLRVVSPPEKSDPSLLQKNAGVTIDFSEASVAATPADAVQSPMTESERETFPTRPDRSTDLRFVRPVFESLQSEVSHVRSQNQGLFTIRGFFLPLFPTLPTNSNYPPSTQQKIIRVGWYGENVPVSRDGFPERASWISVPTNRSTQIYFRVNRVRLFEQGLWSIATVMMHLWAPFLIQYRRFNPQLANVYAEHHEYRLLMSAAPQRQRGSSHVHKNFPLPVLPHLDECSQPPSETCATYSYDISVGETTLSIAVLTFFQQEHARVGPVVSILAALGLAGVFLVLIHRNGAFFICFRRHEAQTPRLMVSSFLKYLSRGRIAENHVIGSFEAADSAI